MDAVVLGKANTFLIRRPGNGLCPVWWYYGCQVLQWRPGAYYLALFSLQHLVEGVTMARLVECDRCGHTTRTTAKSNRISCYLCFGRMQPVERKKGEFW